MAQNDGYSAPFILQDILTQKRAAQHQKLIDSLDLVTQQANMENQAKQREQQAQDAKDTAAYRTGQLQNDTADRLSREKIASMKEPTPPGIISEYEYALKQGYKGDFNKYQTEDANRKRVNPPAGPNYSYSGVDPKTGRPFTINNKTGQSFTMDDAGKPVLYLGPAGAKPSAAGAGKKGSGVSASEFNLGTKLRGAATPKAGMFPWSGNSPAADKDVAAFNQWQQNTISNYDGSPDVKDTIREVLAKDSPSIPTADIIKTHAGVFNPQELEQFSDLLTVLRGN